MATPKPQISKPSCNRTIDVMLYPVLAFQFELNKCQRETVKSKRAIIGCPGLAGHNRPRVGDRSCGDDFTGRKRRELRLPRNNASEVRERGWRSAQDIGADTCINDGFAAPERQLE